MSDDFPTIQAELARKSLDAIIDIVYKQETNSLPAAIAYHKVDTICQITQGLIPNEDWNKIYETAIFLKKRCILRANNANSGN